MQQQKEQLILQKRTKIKKTYAREINNLRNIMDKRKQQRSRTIYNLSVGKTQSALITARQLIHASHKLWKQFYDQYIQQFQQINFFRTSKSKQHTQYLLDCVLICKVFVISKKKDDILEVIQKIQTPVVQVIHKSQLVPEDKQKILRYNQMKQILCRTCAAFLSFIEIAKFEKCPQYVERLYEQYNDFVEKYYGPFQLATVKFMYANYLYQNQKYRKALDMFEICLTKRKQNCFNEAYVDVLVNSAVCLRQLGKIGKAIERMMSAIQISKDLQSSKIVVDDYHLFLAKLYLQNADFKQAYKNYLITYKMRQHAQSYTPEKCQIQLNLIFFYKTLQKMLEGDQKNIDTILTTKQKKDDWKRLCQQIMKDMQNNILNRQQFAKYDQFNKKMAHLTLSIPQPFFDLLSSLQVMQVNAILQKIATCSFDEGVNSVIETTFIKQKKKEQLLLAANPILSNALRERKKKNKINVV